MAQGMTVCKYGMTTKYTCGEIVTKFYQPSNCISGATATYIHYHRNGVDMISGNDSGGPVFILNTAYGINNCGVSYATGLDDAISMATDYVEFGLDITVLTAP